MKHCFALAFTTGLAVCASLTPLVAKEKKSPEARLQQLLKAYPDADTDKDGKLSREEAKAHLAANPESKQKRKADGKAKETVGAQSPEQFEAREFKGVKYRLLKPIDLAKNPDTKYPMLLSLHGAAGVGNDNVKNLTEWGMNLGEEEWRRKHPCFVVVPQSPGMWQTPGTTAVFTI